METVLGPINPAAINPPLPYGMQDTRKSAHLLDIALPLSGAVSLTLLSLSILPSSHSLNLSFDLAHSPGMIVRDSMLTNAHAVLVIPEACDRFE